MEQKQRILRKRSKARESANGAGRVTGSGLHEPRTAEVSLRGASTRSCNVTVLASADIHAHDDFENPHAVEPERKPASVTGSSFAWTFKPASLTKLEIELV